MATTAVMCVVLAGTGWWQQDRIKGWYHTFFDIGPFAKKEIWPHVLDTASEHALEPLTSFAECAAVSMCPEMVVIPPGKFTMGSDNGLKNEGPAHPVEIAARFAVSKYEITNDQWMSCVRHGWCPDNLRSQPGTSDQPVVQINWYEAQIYVDWLSTMTRQKYRLLSESEWEYVARAGTATPYYWDDPNAITLASSACAQCNVPIEPGHANCAQCSNGEEIDDRGLLPIGRFPPNQFGLCDTRGNAWEFVADTVHRSYAGAPEDGSVWWTEPNSGERIARGGSFSSISSNLTASYRFFMLWDDRYPGVGFRVARTLIDDKSADATSAQVKSMTRHGSADRRNTCQIEQLK